MKNNEGILIFQMTIRKMYTFILFENFCKFWKIFRKSKKRKLKKNSWQME